MYKSLIQILIALAIPSLVQCAPPSVLQGARMGSNESQGTTGFVNPEGVPYTIGGDLRLALAETGAAEIGNPSAERATSPPTVAAPPASVPTSSPKGPSLEIATEIKAVRFVRYNSEGKIDRFGTHSFKIDFEFTKDQPLSVVGQFKTREMTERKLSRVAAKGLPVPQRPMSFDIEFEDDIANNYSTGKIFLLNNRKISKAEIYLRSYAARLSSYPMETDALSLVNKRLLKLIDERGLAWVTNSVVQGGRSFYQVHVFAVIEKNSQAADKVDLAANRSRLFSFAGEALRTGDYSDRRAQTLENGLLRIQNAELIGDAETSDERTFTVILLGEDSQTLDFAIKIQKASPSEKISPPTPELGKTLIGLTDKSFLKANYLDDKFPRTRKMIDDFEKNYSLPGVQRWIQRYTRPPAKGGRNYPAELLNALKNSGSFRMIIESIFQMHDIAPQASLVTFFESPFFTSNGYPLRTNPESTATGPAQLLYDTAVSLGLKAVRNPFGVLPPPSDQRLYFVPSACGCAAHYEKSLMSVAKHDSTLAFSAYYLGDFGAAKEIHKAMSGQGTAGKDPLSTVLRYRINYRDVSNQRMLPPSVIDYTDHALALYFVTGNPEKYNLILDFSNSPPLPKGKMMPKEAVRIERCNAAISSLMGRGIL